MYQVIVLENGTEKPISEWPTESQALFDAMDIEVKMWRYLGLDVHTIVNQVSGSNEH